MFIGTISNNVLTRIVEELYKYLFVEQTLKIRKTYITVFIIILFSMHIQHIQFDAYFLQIIKIDYTKMMT